MPRAAAAAKEKNVPKKAAPKKRKPRAYKLPETIPAGEVLTDLNKKDWKLGPTVGKGGFGELYLAGQATAGPVGADARFVIKIEPKENGPLFVEQAFYQRSAKPDMVDEWKKKHKLPHLGVPKFIGAGMHSRGKSDFRFLVMERFGEDIWKKYLACGKCFTAKTAFTLGIQILDSLAYLHSTGYAHADIKSANLLLGYQPKEQNQVYLVDFGLAVRFCPNGQHREYKEDPKKAHDGTPEFTSRDAHNGVVPSRRGDLEILGYVLIQWLAGSLPWEHKISEANTDFPYVMNAKKQYMSNIGSLMKKCFPAGDHPVQLQQYMEYVSKLKYEEVPDYKHLKALFTKAITGSGCKADGKLDFTPPSPPAGSSRQAVKSPGRKRKAVGGTGELPKKAARVDGARKPAVSSSASGSDSDVSKVRGRRPQMPSSPKPNPAAGKKKPVAKSSSASGSDSDVSKVRGRRPKMPSSPKPNPAAGKKKPVAKSPIRSPVRSLHARSPPGVTRGQAKPVQSTGSRRPQGTKRVDITAVTAASGEVFTKKRRQAAVATATSSTQTSPGLRQMAKIKRKR